jgi:tetratricopeptide (TPR) repeat protein
MEIDWEKYQLDRYFADGKQALQHLGDDNANDFFVECSLSLLTRYLGIPPQVRINPDLDEVMVRMAGATYGYIWPKGYWDRISLLWPRVAAIAQHLPDPTLRTSIIHQLSMIKNNQGAIEEAIELRDQLLASPDFHLLSAHTQANLYHHIGTWHVREGNYRAAQDLLTRCFTISTEHNLWELKAYALNQLGNIAMIQGDFQKARRCYEDSLVTLEENGEADNLACVAYQSLGRFLVLQQQHKQAIPLLEKGLAIRRRWPEQEGIATNAVYLALAYMECGRLDEAEILLNEALLICKDLNYSRGAALCYSAFGQLETKRENRANAIMQYEQALAILGETPLPSVELRVLFNLLQVLLHTGQIRKVPWVFVRLIGNLHRQKLNAMTIWRLALIHLKKR